MSINQYNFAYTNHQISVKETPCQPNELVAQVIGSRAVALWSKLLIAKPVDKVLTRNAVDFFAAFGEGQQAILSGFFL